MKTKVLSLVALFVLGAVSVFAGNKAGKTEVKGNCGMCESRIEKAVLLTGGIENVQECKESTTLLSP